MNDPEQIYAMFVATNPVPDPESLPETYQDALDGLARADSDHGGEVIDFPWLEDQQSARHRARGWGAAAAVILAIALSALALTRGGESGDFASDRRPNLPLTEMEQATTFMTRLEAGQIDAAVELLSDPLGSVWFISVGQVTSSEQIRDYLEFYRTIGVTTQLSNCGAEVAGPRSTVTCRAVQRPGALELVGLGLPPFDMVFEVWEDGIRTIGWIEVDPGDFDRAFEESRFFEFRDSVLRPAGLIGSTGDPIWSEANAEAIAQLAADFAADFAAEPD